MEAAGEMESMEGTRDEGEEEIATETEVADEGIIGGEEAAQAAHITSGTSRRRYHYHPKNTGSRH